MHPLTSALSLSGLPSALPPTHISPHHQHRCQKDCTGKGGDVRRLREHIGRQCMQICSLAPTHSSVVTAAFAFSAAANATVPSGPISLASSLHRQGGGVRRLPAHIGRQCMQTCSLAPTHSSVVTVALAFSAAANAAAPSGPMLLHARLYVSWVTA